MARGFRRTAMGVAAALLVGGLIWLGLGRTLPLLRAPRTEPVADATPGAARGWEPTRPQGPPAPDCTLARLDGKGAVTLGAPGRRPAVLIFASYT